MLCSLPGQASGALQPTLLALRLVGAVCFEPVPAAVPVPLSPNRWRPATCKSIPMRLLSWTTQRQQVGSSGGGLLHASPCQPRDHES